MAMNTAETNPRWLSAAFTAVPILLSILYAAVAQPSKPTKLAETVVATRTP